MVNEPTREEIALDTFLKSAGQSFSDAQQALVPGLDVPVNMMLSTAELEVKVSVSSDAAGKMTIKPISSADLARGGIDAAALSTIRISFVSSIGEVKSQPVAKVPATTNTPTAATTTTPTTPTADKSSVVPDLGRLTLDKASVLLKSAGWQFEPHAADEKEIAVSGKQNQGLVLRQDPAAGKPVDKTKTVIHFWVDLGNTPVVAIDGIGPKFSESLAKIGVGSIGALSLANSSQLAASLRIGESRAASFVEMAALMSRLTIIGFKDEVVELLVKGAAIKSVDQLAGSDAALLYKTCQEAVSTRKVQVPQGFSFNLKDVTSWIKSAKSYIG